MESRDHLKNAASPKSHTIRGNFLRISMKKCVVLFIFFFAAILSGIAQDSSDIVYLKNGNTLKGVITELRLNDYQEIKTTDGRVRTIEMSTVDRIEKEGARAVTGAQSDQRQTTVQTQPNSTSPQSSSAQDSPDAVYLKNGNVLKGVITELRINDFLDIKTTDGRVRTIEMSAVEKIERGDDGTAGQRQNTAQNQNNSTSSQSDAYDVVYLKNGTVVKGFITELRLNDFLDIATTEGRVRTIEMSVVERIEKEGIRAVAGTQSNQRQTTVQNSSSTYSQNNSQYSQNNNRYPQNNQPASRSRTDYGYDNYYTPQKRVNFGVIAGLNLTNLIDKDNDALRFKAGFNGGVFGEFKFGRSAIQPELLFSMLGAKMIDEADLHLNYLNIPVMAKYYFTERFCIEVGPQIGLLLSAKVKATGEGVSASVDIKNQMNKIDFTVNAGLSYQLPGIPLGFYMRSYLGLIDVAADGDDGNPVTNLVLQVGTFVKF